MTHFSVRPKALKSQAEILSQYKNSLDAAQNTVKDVQMGLGYTSSESMANIKRHLGQIDEGLLDKAAKMDSLKEALFVIAQSYEQCENKLTGSGEEMNSDLKSWWNGLIKAIRSFLGMEEEKPEPLSEERQKEKQQDLYMQGEIKKLMEQDGFSKKTWNKASIEERKEILTRFLAEISGIMGIQVNDKIKFENMGSNTRGSYSSGSNRITINESYLERRDSYQIMQTMIHEMRHAYQHAVVEHPENFQVSQETVNQWRKNFEAGNYKTPEKDGYEAYVTQPIEYDAKNFAEQYGDLNGKTPVYEGSWGN